MEMDVLISTDQGPLDMKTGLDTMQGVSNAIRTVVDGVVNNEVQKKITAKDKIRTSLKKNFKGSYGQIFSVDIYDDELKDKFLSIPEKNWGEIISYFLKESIYSDGGKLSKISDQIIKDLGEKEDEIINRIRYSCLKDAHQVSMRFKESVTIRSRLKMGQEIALATFDDETANVLKPIRSKKTIKISAIITRLNIHTGNGRLQVQGENETVAFGFGIKYKDVVYSWKKKFSKNLDFNNGRLEEAWEFINLVVEPVQLRSGKVVKFIVKSYEE